MKRFFIYFLLLSYAGVFAQTSDRFTILNVDANTKDNEFGTILTNDGAIFYSKSTFKNTTDFNEKAANLYKGVLEPKGQVSKGLKFPTEATHAIFSNDGSIVYYSKKNGNKNFQLYKARVDRTGRWKNSIKLPFNNPNYTFKQPALNQDNTKLYFVSDIPVGFGKNDIYYVDIINNGMDYGDPKNLGEAINSSGNEMYPFIGEKEKIYFSSDGREGMGGLDIFESFFEDGFYKKTTNLDAPINSPKDDFAYVLIPDTNKGYFSSNRIDGFGGVDIYYFEDKKPSLNKCAQSIEGVVKNKANQKGIFEVTVEIFSSQDHIGTQLTNYKGEFLFDNVECSERYDIVCYKEGWNGFAEVQTVPESGNKLILYLDTDFPEEYVEEFDVSNEMVVFDTQTNEVIKTETDLQNDIEEEGLSFAEKRERDRIKKERIKRERIEAEMEAERIEKQKLEAQRLAAAEAMRLAADKEKNERIAKAKAMAEKLRKEKELAEKTEAERLEIERIAAEKAIAKEREEKRIQAEKELQARLEEERIAREEQERKEKIEAQRIAQELAEQKRIEAEKQAALIAQREAIEKERQQRIAEAKATAERLRQEREAADKTEQEIAKQNNVAAQNQITQNEQQTDTNITEKNSTEDNTKSVADKQREAIELDRQQRIAEAKATAERLRQEREAANKTEQEIAEQNNVAAQNQITRNEQQTDTNITEKNSAEDNTKSVADKQREAIELERQQRIAEAKATAEKLRQEREAADKTAQEIAEQNNVAAQNQITQNEQQTDTNITEKNSTEDNTKSIADKQREAIELERQQRIAEAQATADRLRREQELARIETEKTIALNEQRKKELRESQANLRKLITKQRKATNSKSNSKKEITSIKKREELIIQEKANAERLLKEELAAVNERIQREKAEKDRARRIAEAQATADRLRRELNNQKTATEIENTVATTENSQKTEMTTDTKSSEETTQIDNTTVSVSGNQNINTVNSLETDKIDSQEDDLVSNNKKVPSTNDSNEITEEVTPNTDSTNISTPEERCARDIDGLIQNSINGQGLANANIDMYFDGQNIESTTTDSNGEFHFYNVDCNTKYTLICFKKDFNNIAKADIDTESIPDQIVLLLDPDPIEVVALEEKPQEVKINSDKTIIPEKKVIQSKEIKEIPKKVITEPKEKVTEVSKPTRIEKNTDNEPTEVVEIKEEQTVVADEPKIEIPKIKEGKILINPIYFDLDEYYLTLPARRELDKIIVIMRENPTMIIESGSHTDTRGNFDYNLNLSEKRSQEVVGYLVANGADPDRISGRGYGETMPVNHCLDGVKCSEREHLENRRTEFVILRY
jgi:outer membrane protein OmpA-like peptidoglycan-associated protein